MDKDKPIYTFQKLKTTLKELGYQIEKAEAYRPIKPVDVSIEDIKNGTIEITDEGIIDRMTTFDEYLEAMGKN